ncbi:MAG TPA: TIR domain-containing protein [Actinokineospora sp.]|nr:TIR domain-containing protein [Actinokineospora sp.]
MDSRPEPEDRTRTREFPDTGLVPKPRDEVVTGPEPVTVFISYSVKDERWANWIAHELDAVGYRVIIQSWHFVPGTHFLEFIDRSLRMATIVIAVLSSRYLQSGNCRMEWLSALQDTTAKPGRKYLVPIRIEDVYPDGLLGPITFVDMVGIDDPDQARRMLLDQVDHALSGRATPKSGGFPGRLVVDEPTDSAAVFPPSESRPDARREVSVLHVAAPRFGHPESAEPVERITALAGGLRALGAAAPDLVVVAGSLTESGTMTQFEQALGFLTGLQAEFGLEPGRIVVVPGSGDITGPACEAYFADCRADGVEPRAPYFRKWRHLERMFKQFYPDLDGPGFDAGSPWSLFVVPDLQVVVAGINSTVNQTHLSITEPGQVGEQQAQWFAERLAEFEQAGQLRIGVVAHGPTSAGALADAAMVDRVLGPRLNLLLTGTAADSTLDSGLVVSAPAAGDRLLRVTQTGMAGWDLTSPGMAPTRVDRRWSGVGRTFAEPEPGPAFRPDPEPVRAETTAAMSPLTQRIIDVCEVRHPGAQIRRMHSSPTALRVSYADGPVVQQYLVAAVSGTPTRADVADFAQLRRGYGLELAAELVYDGPPPGLSLQVDARREAVRMRSFTEFQGLLDLRGYVAAQTDRLLADRIYPPDLYVPQRFRETAGTDTSVRDDVVGELLDLLSADEARFILLMGDFGRGKSFAMRRLAIELATHRPDIAPVLIELRSLDKSHSVDGLIAAHLANHGESRIDLRAFRYLLRQGRVVLIFDGFDELAARVSYDRAADHLNTLLAAAENKAKIVVTSRTQHFQSNAQVRTALGERVGQLAQRRVLMLEDFTPAQVGQYLVNRYGQDERAAVERAGLINEIDDLGGLSSNPRMLSFIADLDPSRLRAVAGGPRGTSAAALYREILTAWLAHEHDRSSGMPGSPVGLSIPEMWLAVTTLAMRMWESGESLLRFDDVAEVAKALTGLVDTPLSVPQATHAVGAGSLLVRTEDDLFGFIHSSVMEWLVANAIADQLRADGGGAQLLSRRPLSQLTVDFLCDLADARRLQALVALPSGDDFGAANALKISKRLRTPMKADLRGASLRGEDLSHRDFSGVDLTGADLSDTLLVGTKFTGAVLAGVRLHRARLDQAVLRDADLTGADLTGARLPEADLRGASVRGSRWFRSALINVAGDQALWTAPELHGAAFAPGQPLISELPPASVGVAFGFEDGRLPRPMAYSPDGSVLAVGSADGGILLCDTDKGLPIRTLNGHFDRVYAVEFGSAESALVSASTDGSVRFWDSSTGEPCARITDHAAPVWPLSLGPDGRTVAYGDAEGVLWVRQVPSGDLVRRLPGHGDRIWALAFHPDPAAARVAAADESGVVRIWDLATGTEEHRWTAPGGAAVYTLSFSPDGTTLAAGGRDTLLWLCDTTSGAVHVLPGHRGHVYSVAFHPSGDWLASGDTAGNAKLWSTSDMTGVALAHRQATAIYHLAFSPDGTVLAGGDSDGTLRLWDAASGQPRQELRAHRGAVWPLVFRADSTQVATTGRDGTVRLWDPHTGVQRHEFHGHSRRVSRVEFSPSGEHLATSGNDGVIRLWDPGTGRQVTTLAGRADQLVAAVFSPGKPTLATSTNDGGVYLWHTETWRADQELDVGTDYVWAAAFDRSGEVLATANDDDSVQLWWQATGRNVGALGEHRGRVRSIAFAPSGPLVATGCDDGKVRLFDRDTFECLATLPGHTDRVYEVRFSPNGELVASISNDGTVILWDVRERTALRTFSGHRGKLWTGDFSPDGRTLAAAGDDTVVHLWDVETGVQTHALTGHSRRIWSLAFSPDGRTLASGADDGTARLWDLAHADGPRHRMTLIGLAEAWVAMTPDGRYKFEGQPNGEFWHTIGLCRFEVGELDPFLRQVAMVPIEEPF